MRIIASIEDPEVIEKILKYLGLDKASKAMIRSPPAGLFDHSTLELRGGIVFGLVLEFRPKRSDFELDICEISGVNDSQLTAGGLLIL